MPPKKASAEASAEKPARRPRSTQKFIRNLYGTPVGLRLSGGERIDLRPRGQRGDLAPISKEQEKDSKLMLNLGLVVELVSEAEATQVVVAQNTNQQAYHPALQILRNEHGNEYSQQDIRVEADPQQQGEVVAQIKDGQIVTQHVPGRGEQMVREPNKPRSVGPNVATHIAGSDAEMAQLLQADDIAKSGTSLEEVLGGYSIER